MANARGVQNNDPVLFFDLEPHSYQYEDWRVILKKYKCDSICLGGADYEAIKNK